MGVIRLIPGGYVDETGPHRGLPPSPTPWWFMHREIFREKMMTGIERIAAERQRQIDVEGWTPEHDDKHTDESLAKAASCYAYTDSFHAYIAEYAENGGRDLIAHVPRGWPWHRDWWKPGPDRVRELVKAGALLAAEIDRLQRFEENNELQQSK